MYKNHLIFKPKSTEKLTQEFRSDWSKTRVDQMIIDDIANTIQT